MMATPRRLSKTRFMAGLQCPRRLWWEVHEPRAPELVPDAATQAIFDRGHRVGALARTYVPGGVLIDLPHYMVQERVDTTATALASGAPAIYEASFIADGVFVSVDILERNTRGFALVEVKSTLSVKEEHLPDVAIQTHVLRRSGIDVESAEVMHLNRECRYPDLSNLFVRENVAPMLTADLGDIPQRVGTMLAMIEGPLPDVAIGPHCTTPHDCPFCGRCWPELPENHISTLYRIHEKKLQALIDEGINTLFDLPEDYPARGPAARQLSSIRQGAMIIEPGLGKALAGIKPPIAFLDFETIAPAVPVWPGCAPFQQIPVQFSCHLLGPDGLQHYEWLAEGADDPREALAQALIAACAGANTVLVYNETFEKRCIKGLIQALPHLAADLMALSSRIRDLLPIIRNHVYHPDFHASFSIKTVYPALVGGPGYEELAVHDGGTASDLLEAILLDGESFDAEERQRLRENLLRYCGFDTLAMVRLYERLGQLAE